MKKLTFNRFFCKTIAVFFAVIIVAFSAELLVFAGWGGAANSNDVLIQILGGSGAYGAYRFSCDIVYYNMTFTFNVTAYESNTQTGETYITSGKWFMDENEMDKVPLVVVNHSDTPILVTAFVEQEDFDSCGASVLREGLQNTVIPACELTDKGVIVSESEMTLILENFPSINKFKGEKQFFVTVFVSPTSGYTTGGAYFNYERN